MTRKKDFRDPRGHSLRIYTDAYDSPAFRALSPHDVLAYLALLRELKGYNNGDLSLPLTRAKRCGIGHHLTLARSLRALCSVGFIAVTRKGGCTKGGQRLPTLYRMTDRECYDIPAKHLEAKPATDEWKKFTTVDAAQRAIEAAEALVKEAGSEKKSLGHGVTSTMSSDVLVKPKTRTPRDTWDSRLGHAVTMAENAENPMATRVCDDFQGHAENAVHRTPHVPPLYIASPMGEIRGSDCAGEPTTGRIDVRNADTLIGQILRSVSHQSPQHVARVKELVTCELT